MFDARYIPADGGPAKSLRAEDYAAAVHKDRVLCGDFNCQARLHYRSQSMRFGHVEYRMPHFVTFRDSQHIDDCTHYNASTEEKALRNIPRALAEGKNILVNINMDLGLPLAEGVDAHDLSTVYGRFLARNNHLAVSVKSASDLLRVRDALLRHGGADALKRAYAGHHLELRKFENVFIDDDKTKLKSLFNALSTGEGAMMHGPQTQVTGFPRLFLFKPTKNTAEKGTRASHINGTSQCITGRGEAAVMLLQSLGLHNSDVRRDILEGQATYVFAAPVYDPRTAFQKAGKDFVKLTWRVTDESQYVAQPGQPKLI